MKLNDLIKLYKLRKDRNYDTHIPFDEWLIGLGLADELEIVGITDDSNLVEVLSNWLWKEEEEKKMSIVA